MTNVAPEQMLRIAAMHARTKQKAQAGHQDELDRCARDGVYWCNTYAKTFDPRPKSESDPRPIGIIPFALYDYQEKYWRWLDAAFAGGGDAITEKSRDMGATWVNIAWHVHKWLFVDGFQSLWGSRKEELVDNWQHDSLFGRASIIVDHLPKWMLPLQWNRQKHRAYMKLVNPDRGNVISGESANASFARQGRYSTIMLDEFAFWEWAESVNKGTRDATWLRSILSTPNGSNTFKKLRDHPKARAFTMHWRLHPKKTELWYQQQKETRTEDEVAQELDISYAFSLTGRVYPEVAGVPVGEFPYEPGWPLWVAWDYGLGDATALIWIAKNPLTGMFRVVDAYSGEGKTIDYYVPFVSGKALSGLPYAYSESDLEKIRSHAAWSVATHVGDPAGKQRNQVTGTSVIDELAKFGVYVETKPERNLFEHRYHDTKMMFRRLEGINADTAMPALDALLNARFPKRRESSQSTSEITLPIHDWTSHYRTAFEYFCVNLEDAPVPPPRGDEARERSAWEDM